MNEAKAARLTRREPWEYLRHDLFSGDKGDSGVRNESAEIVRTRKTHECLATDECHEIPTGSLAVRHKAVFDGRWATWYACLPCIDREIDEWE